MGSSTTMGTSSTFLSNFRERASNFCTCRMLVSCPPAINIEDTPDIQDHTTGNSSGDLWEAPCAGGNTVLLVLSKHRPLVSQSCTFNRGSPNGTEVPALPSKWMADGSQGLRELAVDVQPVQM